MSDIMNISALRDVMRQCNKEAKTSISFGDDDNVTLLWLWGEGWKSYTVTSLKVNQLRTTCRAFERIIHKAKVDML